MNKLSKSYHILTFHIKRELFVTTKASQCRRALGTTFRLMDAGSKIGNNENKLVTCDFSHDNKIALVTFNSPEKLNALSVDMGHAFKSTIEDLSTKDDLRSVILTGKGIVRNYNILIRGLPEYKNCGRGVYRY